MPPVWVFRRGAGFVCHLRPGSPGESPGGAPVPQRENPSSPAVFFAGGGGKPSHRGGRAPRHLHSFAEKPDAGFRPPGKSPVPGPVPRRRSTGWSTRPPRRWGVLPWQNNCGRRGCTWRASPASIRRKAIGTFGFPAGGSSFLYGTQQDASKGCKSVWIMWKNGSSAGLSSAGLEEGCGAKTWVHLAGDPRPLVLLTEGPMKADVIHFLTGQTVLAVAGVNSLSQLRPLLRNCAPAEWRKS